MNKNMKTEHAQAWGHITVFALLIIAFVLLFLSEHACADAIKPTVHDDTTVRVYLTMSYDSEFLRAGNASDLTKRTGKVLARVPVDVSYKDLAEYGLTDYYRYEANDYEDGGEYKNSTIVVQPTVLMLFLRATSLYYLEREITASDIGSETGEYKDALTTSGGATHLYFKRFWGHGENFMYFVNHKYPLQAEGWGSTADYILLEDGDEVDVALFSNNSFNQHGAFECFATTEYNVEVGEEVDLTILASDTTENGKVLDPEEGEPIRISSDYGETWQQTGKETDRNGEAQVTFDEPGIYFVSAGPDFKRNVDNLMKCVAPPIAVVQVSPGVVSGIKTVNPDRNTVKCSWEDQGENVSYTVDYRTIGEKTWKTVTVSGPEAIVSDIDPESCEFRVRAFIQNKHVPYGEAPKAIRSSYSKVVRHTGYVPEDGKEQGQETDPEDHSREEKRKAEILAAKIKAAKAAKPKVTAKALKKHKAKISWKKVTLSYKAAGETGKLNVTGYKIYRATKKAGKYRLIKTIKKADTLKYTDKKLKKGRKYFYKVRTYTKINGKNYSGKWSAVKMVKGR